MRADKYGRIVGAYSYTPLRYTPLRPYRLHIVREAAEDPLAATRAMLDRIENLDKRAQQAALRFLSAWRKDIVAEIATAKDFEAFRLPKLLNSVDRLAEDWAEKYGIETKDLLKRGFDVGVDKVDLPIRAAGIEISLPAPSLSILQASQRATVDFIAGLSRDAAQAIKREILLGANGGRTPFEVIEEVGRNLEDPSVFGTIANRAEVITRTEIGRIQSIATQVRQEDAKKIVPGLQKQWLSSFVQRTNHMAINKQIREVEEPFDVPAAPRLPAEQLMFPRDPNGSAGNTINCGCQSLPYKEDWGLEQLAA